MRASQPLVLKRRQRMSELSIKLAYMVATPEVKVEESVTAYQGDMKEAFSRLAALGYDGAELMMVEPDRVDRDRIERLSREYGIEVPVICTGEVYGQARLSFMDPDESVRREAIRRTKGIIDFASCFGAQVNIGRLRGRLFPDTPREKSIDWMYAAFEDVTDYAAERGITMTLEPIAHIFCNNINSTHEGVDVVKRVGRDNFRLMADVFHMNLEDASVEAGFTEMRPYLSHIHVCDSNRLAPGRGNFDFKTITEMIKQIGYRAYISAEIFQFPSQDIVLEETIKHLKPLL
jgi:sugar phosphate isomerase/epimerase